MKNIFKLLLTSALTLSLLAGCANAAPSQSSEESSSSGEVIITVGASITPHSEILAAASPLLSEKGYELKIVEYTDYILPNTALDSGELDANFFQHTPYLDEFNSSNGTDISSAVSVHFEPLGIYSDKLESLDDLREGAVIAVPSDTSNQSRALLLLEANGIIKLKDGTGVNASKLDIVENPLNIEIKEIESAQLSRILPDVDLACINGNYALQGGLTSEDALTFESNDSVSAQTYANILAVQTENLDSEKTKALVEVLTSQTVKDFIDQNYDSSVIPVF